MHVHLESDRPSWRISGSGIVRFEVIAAGPSLVNYLAATRR
jgi:hypothetical protein